jgi:hypothetical protein
LKSVNLQTSSTLISSEVVNLFTNVPADEALIFMEHFEKLAFDLSHHKPLLLLQYVDDIYGLGSWPKAVTVFPQPLNSVRPTMQSAMEVESAQLSF